MPTTTTNPLDALLFVRNGDMTARWNFKAAVGSLISAPAGLGSTVNLSYSFLTAAPLHDASIQGFEAFSPAQAQAARSVLSAIAEVANVRFTETVGVGQLTFGNSTQPNNQNGYAYAPSYTYTYGTISSKIMAVSEQSLSGDVWLNREASWGAQPWQRGGEGYGTLVHEVGHALGLKHPFEAPDAGFFLAQELDNTRHTVMSYTPAPHTTLMSVSGSEMDYSWTVYSLAPSTLMPLDIEALQHLYGANTTTRAGNDTYQWAANPKILETIWDGGGIDTIDCSNQTLRCVIDLHEGAYSSIALRQTDAEKRAGLEIPSWFKEPLPADLYDGSQNVAIAKGVVIENAKGGSAADQLLGNDVANVLSGGGGNDLLMGYGGDDTLDGGLGNDTMIGGQGNDVYYVHNLGDVVAELAGEGNDTVYSYLTHTADKTYTLGANIENGRIATTTASNMTGNELDNLLYAGAGSNILVGGAGNDTVSYQYGLASGAQTGVTVKLALSTAQATGSSGLDLLVNVENLTGSSLNDTLTGNDGNNVLDGGGGNDVLVGGSGHDVLYGRIGNDTLYGGAGNDTLWGGVGNDTLYGGTGRDVMAGGDGKDIFIFNAASETNTALNLCDVITDFTCGQDKLNLSGIDANTSTAQNDAFLPVLLGTTEAFTAAGQLRFEAGVLYGNVDMDFAADFAIKLTGVMQLSVSDFIL